MAKDKLDQQVDRLLRGAAAEGESPNLVGLIAPVLKAIAQKLARDRYFVLQDIDGCWATVVLSNLNAPDIEKTVVYAYATETAAQIARLKLGTEGQDLRCVAYDVVEILFRFVGMKQTDSLIVFDQTNHQTGMDIRRLDLEKLCMMQIERVRHGHQQLQNLHHQAIV